MKLTRRTFIGTTAAATVAAPMVSADGHGRPRVVVIGGGPGGATAARYIAKDSDGQVSVTLVEPTRKFYTCFFSNLYIGGFKEIEDIGHTYGSLAAAGVNVVHDWAVGVDGASKSVSLAGGDTLGYDKLILSPASTLSKALSPDGICLRKTRCRTPTRQVRKANCCGRSCAPCLRAASTQWLRRRIRSGARRDRMSGFRWWRTT